jgi:hypothetical protein
LPRLKTSMILMCFHPLFPWKKSSPGKINECVPLLTISINECVPLLTISSRQDGRVVPRNPSRPCNLLAITPLVTTSIYLLRPHHQHQRIPGSPGLASARSWEPPQIVLIAPNLARRGSGQPFRRAHYPRRPGGLEVVSSLGELEGGGLDLEATYAAGAAASGAWVKLGYQRWKSLPVVPVGGHIADHGPGSDTWSLGIAPGAQRDPAEGPPRSSPHDLKTVDYACPQLVHADTG